MALEKPSTVVETIRKIQKINADVPVVVLTGMTDETLGVLAIKNGAMDYLVKGVSLENLLIRITKSDTSYLFIFTCNGSLLRNLPVVGS